MPVEPDDERMMPPRHGSALVGVTPFVAAAAAAAASLGLIRAIGVAPRISASPSDAGSASPGQTITTARAAPAITASRSAGYLRTHRFVSFVSFRCFSQEPRGSARERHRAARPMEMKTTKERAGWAWRRNRRRDALERHRQRMRAEPRAGEEHRDERDTAVHMQSDDRALGHAVRAVQHRGVPVDNRAQLGTRERLAVARRRVRHERHAIARRDLTELVVPCVEGKARRAARERACRCRVSLCCCLGLPGGRVEVALRGRRDREWVWSARGLHHLHGGRLIDDTASSIREVPTTNLLARPHVLLVCVLLWHRLL